MLKDFREFLLRGNLIDLAIAVVIGTAFAIVVKSLVDNIVMPIIGALFGKPSFSELTFTTGSQDKSPSLKSAAIRSGRPGGRHEAATFSPAHESPFAIQS